MTYAEAAVETHGLTKSYGSARVLDGVDLQVRRGTVFALLGPNGAGKTTTVRILATLTTPDAGTARVAGLDVVRDRRAVRRRISLTGQYAAVDDGQTARENLVMMGRLVGLGRPAAARRAAALIERFDLGERADHRVGTYSGGTRRRLDLAVSLLGTPDVIFLDEPTTGLDPRSRRATWDVVAELAAGGTTVFLTTQYLEEADRLAERIAVLDAGHIVAEGSADELKRRVGEQRVDLTLGSPAAFDAVVARLGDRLAHADREHLVAGVTTDGSAAHVRGLLDEVDPHGDAVIRFALHAATLDDVFLTLTGRTAAADPELEPARA
jgi:ABC-2 type transport system ATP-binding protein